MNYPKISIVTPSYNQAEYLEHTIQSVLGQGYPNLEYIIIDGGSTDGSVDIIKKYESQLAYWISERDNGMYEAIQKGFDKSTGEIMAWINSDDMYHPKSLFVVAELFNLFPDVQWLTGANTTFNEKGQCVYATSPTNLTKFDIYQKRIEWIQQESTFWRRKLWDKSGAYINTNLKYAGDFELWLRFFRTDNLVFSSALFGGFRQRSSNQLSLEMLDKYYDEAYQCIDNEKIAASDIEILEKKKENEKLIRKLLKLKFLPLRIINKYKYNPTVEVSTISFDRMNQSYTLNYNKKTI